MLEKIKNVSNPLTIIALFAGLAEIAGTVALATVADAIQGQFVWFVMLFPTLIVVLFFTTLNFNPKVLYAPSDYKEERHFVEALHGYYMKSSTGEVVQLDSKTTLPISHDKFKNKKLIDAANSVMSNIFKSLDKEMDEKRHIQSLGFGIVTDELYLLQLRLNKEKLKANHSDDITWIVSVTEENNNIRYTIPGERIVADNVSEFSRKASEALKRLLERSIET